MTKRKPNSTYAQNRLSAKQCRQLLFEIFETQPYLTSQEIAEQVPVHYSTVCKYRKMWCEENDLPPTPRAKRKPNRQAVEMPEEKASQLGVIVGAAVTAVIVAIAIYWSNS